MSREHLYKAKRVNWMELPKEEWWVEGYYVKHGSRHWIYTGEIRYMYYPACVDLPTKYEVVEETICEYIGLTDKNGMKIFENNILRKMVNVYKLGESAPCGERMLIGTVIWDDSSSIYPGNWSLKSKDERGNDATYTFDNKYEVIGNIFDNPELLEGGKEE